LIAAIYRARRHIDELAEDLSSLAIGSVELESGETVSGFICEQIAVEEAQDVTPYGGGINHE
jgi:hypothetical protein